MSKTLPYRLGKSYLKYVLLNYYLNNGYNCTVKGGVTLFTKENT